MNPLDDFIALSQRLVDRAGEVIRPHFRSGIEATGKDDGSPVTAADRSAELAIREILADVVPSHGVIGEEFGRHNEGAEYLWVIDPIDGTKAFITGKPLFVTLVALLYRGQPVLGVIDQPILGDRWTGAAGRPTVFRGGPARVRPCPSLAEARISTSGPQYFTKEGRQAFERVAERTALLSFGGDGYQYGLVASGSLDVVVESGLKLHDWAALVPIVAGAGGVITDWQGRSPGTDDSGGIVATGDARCHAEVLAVLGG